MIRSTLLIFSGNAASSLLLFARNLLVALLIPVEDYGIAATLAMAMAAVEMMSAFGLQQQIVQAKNGDDPRLQAGLQGFQVLRGLISGVTLFLLAGPIAAFLKVPEVAWAYRLLAIVPVLNSLIHFDIYRLNREMRFGPMLLSNSIPALVSFLCVWPLTIAFGSYQVMLWAILIQAVLITLISHLVAERRYQVIIDRAIMGNAMKFGWPILLTSILLFILFNGDKAIVGRLLGMGILAIFAMGTTLTLTPVLIISRSLQNLALPKLSAAAADGDLSAVRFSQLSELTIQISILLGVVLASLTIIVMEPIVLLLLGPDYAPLIPLLPLFAILQTVRVLKTATSVISLAKGQNINTMLANLPPVFTLPVLWYLLSPDDGLSLVIAIALLAEIAGYMASLYLARSISGVPLSKLPIPLLIMTAFLYSITLPLGPALEILVVLACLSALLYTMPELRIRAMRHLFPGPNIE